VPLALCASWMLGGPRLHQASAKREAWLSCLNFILGKRIQDLFTAGRRVPVALFLAGDEPFILA